MQEDLIKSSWNYGLGVVLSISITIFMGWVLKYVLRQNEKREDRLAGIIERDLAGLKRASEDAAEKAVALRERLDESNRRIREEHERFDKRQMDMADVVQILILKTDSKNKGG